MSSEWMKVMLGEIGRKKAEAEQARIDERDLTDAHGSAPPVVLESEASSRENNSDHAEHPRRQGRGKARP